ncbi:MAG: ABC transporter ATP-binding protein [Azospirillaceae bacterium]|nr:ABC transporter ATP-binding protein [Azospirillaceae bacterium]
MTLLTVDGISVRYGQLTALRRASISVKEGESLFVTGPNGAGKSTLLKAIAGVVPIREGAITFAGTAVAGKAPEDIARLGFSMVPEGRDVFSGLTIDENLRVGVGMRADKDAAIRDLETVYSVFPMLAERRHRPAGVLSGGQQQMLVIGRALMAKPKLIAIDEPSLGLAPKVIDDVYATLLKLRDAQGLTLLIVEQSSARAMLTGGRMVLMRSGEVVLEGDARELVRGDALKKAYFGYGDH